MSRRNKKIERKKRKKPNQRAVEVNICNISKICKQPYAVVLAFNKSICRAVLYGCILFITAQLKSR